MPDHRDLSAGWTLWLEWVLINILGVTALFALTLTPLRCAAWLTTNSYGEASAPGLDGDSNLSGVLRPH